MPRRNIKTINGVEIRTLVIRKGEYKAYELPDDVTYGEVWFKTDWYDLKEAFLLPTASTWEAEGILQKRALVMNGRLERARKRAQRRKGNQ